MTPLDMAIGVAPPDPAADVPPKKLRPDKASWRKGRNGLYFGRITAANGKIIADYAEGYSTAGACLRALRRDQEKWASPGGLVIFDVPVEAKAVKKPAKKKAAKKKAPKK